MNRYLALGIVIFLAALNLHYFFQVLGARRELRGFETRIEDLKAENSRMKEEIFALENNPFYVEKIARQELGLVREGEWVIKGK